MAYNIYYSGTLKMKKIVKAFSLVAIILLLSNLIFENIFSTISLLIENPSFHLAPYLIILISTSIYVFTLEFKGKKLELKKLIMS